MTTLFVACFVAGVGFSVISFLSGVGHHHHLHLRLPKHSRSASFNLAALTAFLVWFGGGGLLLLQLPAPSRPLVGGGAGVIGLAGATLVNRVIGALMRRETNAQPLQIIGVIAKTVVSIRAGDGTGEIVFTHQGTRRVAGARSDDGRAIDKGTEVVVTRYERGIAYVTTYADLIADRDREKEELHA